MNSFIQSYFKIFIDHFGFGLVCHDNEHFSQCPHDELVIYPLWGEHILGRSSF